MAAGRGACLPEWSGGRGRSEQGEIVEAQSCALVSGDCQFRCRAQITLGSAYDFSLFTTASQAGRAPGILLTTMMFQLVDNDCADNDAAFNNLLPVSGDVGEIENVVQYADNERTHDCTGHGTDTAGR